ncbi:5867_t:CDS:1, partial [Scutellospora calospora]
KLTVDKNVDRVIHTAYQLYLLVNMNIDTQNMIAKEIADLVIIEIEKGDEFS